MGRGLLDPSAWQCASGRGFLSSGAPSDVCLLSGKASVLRGAGPDPRPLSPHVLFPLWLSLLSFCACYRASLSRAALCPHADVFPQVASGSPPEVRAVGAYGSGTTEVDHFSCFSQCPVGTGTTPVSTQWAGGGLRNVRSPGPGRVLGQRPCASPLCLMFTLCVRPSLVLSGLWAYNVGVFGGSSIL